MRFTCFRRGSLAGAVALTSFPCCLIIAAALGQEPTFDAASIKVVELKSHPIFGNRGGPGTGDPGRIHLCCVGMFSLLMRAYDVEIDRIIGPDWIMENMGPNLYEVDATMSPTTVKAQFQQMMQELLRERFHLKIHREERVFPGYELVIAPGGAKLKEALPDPNASPDDFPPKTDPRGRILMPPGPHMFTSLGWRVISVQAQQMPIGALVKVLGRMINQSLGENPNDFASPKARVIDRTGLTGTYD